MRIFKKKDEQLRQWCIAQIPNEKMNQRLQPIIKTTQEKIEEAEILFNYIISGKR